jgi:hypothetical protein
MSLRDFSDHAIAFNYAVVRAMAKSSKHKSEKPVSLNIEPLKDQQIKGAITA